MPRQFMPEPWEACMTLGDHWGWTKNSSYHSSGAIIRYLTRAVARNGNLLLDVGLDAKGELAPQAVTVLEEVGEWLKKNGEAIYNTRPIPPYEFGNVFFTRKPDGTVYAIILNQRDGEAMPPSVKLPANLTDGAKTITFVGGDETALLVKPGDGGTSEVTLPAAAKLPRADAWVLKITPQGETNP
jgi:alpha-L-fucosidase